MLVIAVLCHFPHPDQPGLIDFPALITGFDAEACWPLNGPLFSPLNPLYSLMGVGVTGPPLRTNWSGRALQAISSVLDRPVSNAIACPWKKMTDQGLITQVSYTVIRNPGVILITTLSPLVASEFIITTTTWTPYMSIIFTHMLSHSYYPWKFRLWMFVYKQFGNVRYFYHLHWC